MARSFQQMLSAIRKADDVLIGAVIEASAYVLHQYHANNRKVDGAGVNLAAQLLDAVPVWLRMSMKGWLQQGKRDTALDVEKAADMAAAQITGFFREQEQKRAAARAKRADKAQSAKLKEAAEKAQRRAVVAEDLHAEASATVIDAELRPVEVESALVVDGDVQVITPEEARLLRAYLAQLRAPALKVA